MIALTLVWTQPQAQSARAWNLIAVATGIANLARGWRWVGKCTIEDVIGDNRSYFGAHRKAQ